MFDESRASSDEFLHGGGDMGALVRSIDWSRTPLGPTSTWPQSLRTTVSSCLNSRFPILVWWGPELVKIYNDAYRPMLGAKHPASMGAPGRLVWPEIWHIIGPMLSSVMTEGKATWSENQFLPLERHGYAEECYFTFSYSPIRDESGGVGGVLCAVTETTGQIIGERRLHLLQELAAHTAGAVSVQDACDRAVEQLATDPADLPFALLYLDAGDGRTLTLSGASGIAPGTASGPLSIDAQVDDPGRARWSDRALLLPVRTGDDRAPGLLVAGVSPNLALDDRYRGFLALVADHIGSAVSRARAFEQERRRAEALAELDRAKTAFFSNVSHEFRTPLTLMLGPTEDALASPDRTLKGADLETVHRNELRLLKLVNALLDFSRIEAGRMQAAYEPVDLASLTADVASMFRAAIERAGLAFTVVCDPLDDSVYVDREMWEKILLNLLSNALKFTLDGAITVTLRDCGARIELQVSDTGLGIPEQEQPRVFERFHRVEATQGRTQEGSGIGLALVHELVRLNGGDIQVASTPGRGSTFIVSLPKGSAHVPAGQVHATREPAPKTTAAAFIQDAQRWSVPGDSEAAAGHVAGASGYVLVADDNADMREYLSRVLQPHWRVETAADGAAALEAIRRDTPDLVITDVMMPNVDGFHLLRTLRGDETTASIPVIVLSAQAGDEARIGALQRGADDYLVKPFTARELLARVNNQVLLARHARERARLLDGELQARREAEVQRQQLYALFMQAPTPILILRGPRYVIELINPITCTVWGRRHEDLIDRPLFEALPELRGQVFNQLLADVYRTGTPYIGTEVPAHLDPAGDGTGHVVYFNFVYSAVRNARNEIDGIFVIASDVTPQVIARNEMARLRADAESANRAKDEFLAMLGHELRNPLAPIMTALQLMRLREDPGSERERDVIERQVSHLTQLVDDLLDVSRIARGKIDLKRERLPIAEVVTRAIEVASPLLEQRRHVLDLHMPRENLEVDGDAARLRQIVSNLLTNAAKYTEPGGRIAISAERDGDDVVLSVRDNGIGIDAAMLPHIFDLFVQERQAVDRAHGGLGIGLTIVRNLIALHGGSVSAHSEGLGAGSEFEVRLPLVPTEAMVPVAAIDAGRDAPRISPVEPQHALRVLVVDDNVDAARMLSEVFKFRGHDIRVAHDGVSALRTCDSFEPDVALVDIGLPVMDGYELATRLRARGSVGLRLIAVTGYGQETDRQRSMSCGFDEHLVKPIDLDHLEQIIEGIVPFRS